jgi:hypothetical protein
MEYELVSEVAPFAELLGVSNNLVLIAMTLGAALIMSFVVYNATGSIIIIVAAPVGVFLAAGWMGFIPMWMAVVPFIFTVLYFGYRVFMYGGSDADEKPKKKSISITLDFEKASQKFKDYHNNLDELLGISTISVDYENDVGLELYQNELRIDNGYHWYIVDKHLTKLLFKIVGVRKYTKDKQLAYLLGNEDGKPFLTEIKDAELVKDWASCKKDDDKLHRCGFMVKNNEVVCRYRKSDGSVVLEGVNRHTPFVEFYNGKYIISPQKIIATYNYTKDYTKEMSKQ